jgi:DNA mismatch repair protein MutS
MTALAADLPLFQALEGEAVVSGPGPSRLEEALRDTDTDALTPRQALDLIYRLKDIMEEPDN